jgi:hypothetical protein
MTKTENFDRYKYLTCITTCGTQARTFTKSDTMVKTKTHASKKPSSKGKTKEVKDTANKGEAAKEVTGGHTKLIVGLVVAALAIILLGVILGVTLPKSGGGKGTSTVGPGTLAPGPAPVFNACSNGMCMVVGSLNTTNTCFPAEVLDNNTLSVNFPATQEYIDYLLANTDSTAADPGTGGSFPVVGGSSIYASVRQNLSSAVVNGAIEVLYNSSNDAQKEYMLALNQQNYLAPGFSQGDVTSTIRAVIFNKLNPSTEPFFGVPGNELTPGELRVFIPESQPNPGMRYSPAFCDDPAV